MKRTILIISTIILLGGLVHIGIGLSGGLSLELLWFISAGLALVLIASINYLALNIPLWSIPVFLVVLLTNLLSAILLGLLLRFMLAPQVVLLFLLLCAEIVLTIWSYRRMRGTKSRTRQGATKPYNVPASPIN